MPLRLDCPPTTFYPALLKFYLSPREEVRQTLEIKLLNFFRQMVVTGLVIEPSIALSSFFGSSLEVMGE